MNQPPDLDHLAAGAGAELHRRDRHAWAIVVGPIDAARAAALAALVAGLIDHPDLDQVSVDLTCTSTIDLTTARTLDELGAGHPGVADVTRAGLFGGSHLQAA